MDAAAGGFGADEVELVAGAVDQHDPGAPVGRVTLGGLVEHSRDDLLAGGGDRAGQPLCRGDRTLAARPTTSSVGGGVDGDDRREDVVGPAGCGVGVVDDPQGRHPLAALLLPAGQPSPVRARTLGGSGLAGGLAQRLGAHHHALAVHAEHQQRVVGGWRRRRRLVEGVDVAGGRHRELLDLPFAGDLAARSCQCLLRGAERAARRLGRRPAPQGVGVQPLGQVQGGVGGMQVARCVGPPGAAGHPHRAEHRRKVAHVVVLHLPMTGPVGVGDWAGAALSDGVPLPHRAQVQVVLEQQPQQLPAARLQVALELVVGPAARLGAAERGNKGIEGGTGAGKGVLGHAQHGVVNVVVGLHRALSRRSGGSTRKPTRRSPALHLRLHQAAASRRRPAPQPPQQRRRTAPARPRPASRAPPAA